MMKYIKWFVLVLLLGTMTIQSLRVYRDVKNVLSYRPIVEDILAEHDSVSTEDLVLAMIYTETKGQEADLMQSSESSTGVANTITDSRESIRQGVTVLSENLLTSQSKETDIWTAVQAYNFGSSYIDFV
ncbi:lysozyme family protein, partial [Streptococcus pluranimalium]